MPIAKAQAVAPKAEEALKVDVIRLQGLRSQINKEQFSQAIRILRKNFPPSEIESPAQFLNYFDDEAAGTWFFQVAIDPKGKNAAGVSCYSLSEETGVVMYNLIAVGEDYRRKGVAKQLIDGMLAEASAHAKPGVGATYVLGEIEQPDRGVGGKEGRMRNDIRPKFHDNATKIRALLKPGGKVVKYKLPIMASDEERRIAEKSGNPFIEEELLFAVRPLRNPSATTLPLREVGELIYWFYKEYLGAECHDVRGQDVNRLLAKALTELSGVEITTEEIAGKGRAVLSRIPRNESVTLIKISESEGK